MKLIIFRKNAGPRRFLLSVSNFPELYQHIQGGTLSRYDVITSLITNKDCFAVLSAIEEAN